MVVPDHVFSKITLEIKKILNKLLHDLREIYYILILVIPKLDPSLESFENNSSYNSSYLRITRDSNPTLAFKNC